MSKTIHMDDLNRLARQRAALAQHIAMIRTTQQVLEGAPKSFALNIRGDNGDGRLVEMLKLFETDPVLAARMVMVVHEYAIEGAEKMRAALEAFGIDTVPREEAKPDAPTDIAGIIAGMHWGTDD